LNIFYELVPWHFLAFKYCTVQSPTEPLFLCRSLQRALDNKLYLLLYGNAYGAPDGKPVWHFPEKVYENEETMRLVCSSAILQMKNYQLILYVVCFQFLLPTSHP
jgi:hypothetical protein